VGHKTIICHLLCPEIFVLRPHERKVYLFTAEPIEVLGYNITQYARISVQCELSLIYILLTNHIS